MLSYYNCYSCYRTLPNIQHNKKTTGHSLVAPSFHTRIHASFLCSNSDSVWGQSFSPFSCMAKQEAQSGGLTIRKQTLASTDSRSSAPESCTRSSLLPCVAVSPQTTAFPYEPPNQATRNRPLKIMHIEGKIKQNNQQLHLNRNGTSDEPLKRITVRVTAGRQQG